MLTNRFTLIWLCLLFTLVGCKTPKVLPPPNLLTANRFDACLQILRDGLHSDDFWPSIYAAEALIDAGYRFESIPVLQELLEKEPDDVYKASIAKALIRGGEEEAIVFLQNIILSDNETAKIESLKGMFYEVSVADTSIVGNVLRETDNVELKLYAQALLHITDNKKHIEEIRTQLSSTDPAIRVAAMDIIPLIGSSDPDTTLLIPTLTSTATNLEKLYAIRALAMLDHAPSRNRIPELMRDTDPNIRSLATFAMAEAWVVEHVDDLYPLLEDPSIEVRVRAAQALLTMNNSSSLYRYLRIR